MKKNFYYNRLSDIVIKNYGKCVENGEELDKKKKEENGAGKE